MRTRISDRRHVESLHHYRFFCTFEGAEYLAFTTAPDVPVTVVGDEFRVASEPAESGLVHRFWHTPMERGRVYDLRFRIINPDPEEPGWLTEESLAFHEPTRFASFEVSFAGKLPIRLWQFSGLTHRERPGRPTHSDLFELQPMATTNRYFRDLYGGLYAGLAWEW